MKDKAGILNTMLYCQQIYKMTKTNNKFFILKVMSVNPERYNGLWVTQLSVTCSYTLDLSLSLFKQILSLMFLTVVGLK